MINSPYVKLSKTGIKYYNSILAEENDLSIEHKILLVDVIDLKEYHYRNENYKWYHNVIEKIFNITILIN